MGKLPSRKKRQADYTVSGGATRRLINTAGEKPGGPLLHRRLRPVSHGNRRVFVLTSGAGNRPRHRGEAARSWGGPR